MAFPFARGCVRAGSAGCQPILGGFEEVTFLPRAVVRAVNTLLRGDAIIAFFIEPTPTGGGDGTTAAGVCAGAAIAGAPTASRPVTVTATAAIRHVRTTIELSINVPRLDVETGSHDARKRGRSHVSSACRSEMSPNTPKLSAIMRTGISSAPVRGTSATPAVRNASGGADTSFSKRGERAGVARPLNVSDERTDAAWPEQ